MLESKVDPLRRATVRISADVQRANVDLEYSPPRAQCKTKGFWGQSGLA